MERCSTERTSPCSTAAVLVIVALLTSWTASCAPSEPWTADNPELALRSLLTALSFYDYETVWEFLDEPTQDYLKEVAEKQARAMGVDSVPEGPALVEILCRVWTPTAFYVDHLETVGNEDDRATVVIHSIYGTQTETLMTRDGERWTISLVSDQNSGSEPE